MFIVFEGIDGTGKSTQVNLLADFLKSRGKEVEKLFEPTKTSPHGLKIREFVEKSNKRLPVEQELHLFMEDRKYNLVNNVMPALSSGKIVLMDRYYFSTAAYQGVSHDLKNSMHFEKILEMNEKFAPIPDVLFIFTTNVNICLDRIYKNRKNTTIYEKKEMLEKVNDIFLKIHENKKYNSFLIDANQPLEKIHEDIKDIALKTMTAKEKRDEP